jgi:deoxyribose-phosphate aldolase
LKKEEILARVEHTLLKPEATWTQVETLCYEAFDARCAAVCLSPVYVARAREFLSGKLPVCTVIGFPSGAQTPAAKAGEALDAIRNGADELDMVIPIGAAKAGEWDAIARELEDLRRVTAGKILKVIIETCLLDTKEKIRLCKLVSESGADFIKTSTGFSAGGATEEDVRLLRANCAPAVRIKAAGGIRDWATAEKMIQAGADRIGASKLTVDS